MAKGNPRVTIRFEQSELDEMAEAVLCSQEYSASPMEDISAFVRRAVRRDLAHRRRSNAGKRAPVPAHLKPSEPVTPPDGVVPF